jgi:hypothetical protein
MRPCPIDSFLASGLYSFEQQSRLSLAPRAVNDGVLEINSCFPVIKKLQ